MERKILKPIAAASLVYVSISHRVESKQPTEVNMLEEKERERERERTGEEFNIDVKAPTMS